MVQPMHDEALARPPGQRLRQAKGGRPVASAGRPQMQPLHRAERRGAGGVRKAARDQRRAKRRDTCRERLCARFRLEPRFKSKARRQAAIGQHVDGDIEPVDKRGEPGGLAPQDRRRRVVEQLDHAAVHERRLAAQAEPDGCAGAGEHGAGLEQRDALTRTAREAPDGGRACRIWRRAGHAVEPVRKLRGEGIRRHAIRGADEDIRLARRRAAATQVEFQPHAVEQTATVTRAPGFQQRRAARPGLAVAGAAGQILRKAAGELRAASIRDSEVDQHVEPRLARAEWYLDTEEAYLIRAEGGQQIERARLAHRVAQHGRQGGKKDMARDRRKAVRGFLGLQCSVGGGHGNGLTGGTKRGDR